MCRENNGKLVATTAEKMLLSGNYVSTGGRVLEAHVVTEYNIFVFFKFARKSYFVMRRSEESKPGIDWTYGKVLGYLDLVDNICLLNSYVEELQTWTNCLPSNANKVGIFINACKTEVITANCDRKPLHL